MTKPVGIVAILVAEADLEDPLPKLLEPVVPQLGRITTVLEQRREPLGDPEALIELPEQQRAAVGGHLGRVTRHNQRSALELKLDR